MPADASRFSITDVRWQREHSQTLSPYRGQPPPRRASLERAAISCVQCGHHWVATVGEGIGQIRQGLGTWLLECPSCGVCGRVEVGDTIGA